MMTNSASNKAMAAKGKLTLSLNAAERILFIEASGPFNLDFAKDYEQQIMPLREALKPIAWTSLARIYGDESRLTPDSREMLVASIKTARQLGLRATALVLDRNVSEGYLAFWEDLYQESGLPFKVCHDKSDALTFLTLEIKNQPPN